LFLEQPLPIDILRYTVFETRVNTINYLCEKSIVARKETYRQRYTNKIMAAGDQAPDKPALRPRVPVDPALQQQYLEGKVILIDKPLHWTSFDVVKKLRNLLQIKKIGHAGTLDPLATGLLIVCTGKFTRKINEYMAQQKEYTGHITLGAVTPTYDLESEPEQIKDYSAITAEQIQQATKQFIGVIEQYPPIFSAIKKDGVALYELARRGVEVELKARSVEIFEFSVTSINLPVVSFKVVCSTGTYIRSLANDFGKALGCGGYLSSLRRTAIGEFTVEDAVDMDTFEASTGAVSEN
jgi:tRNA pseudouridine55 synthase